MKRFMTFRGGSWAKKRMDNDRLHTLSASTDPFHGNDATGPGNAVFSVSSFMDTLAPTEENADELMAAGAVS
jgi:hypothetical protein